MYVDTSLFASIAFNRSKLRRVCMFGFLMEKLSPNPQCIRTLDPLCRNGLIGPHSGTGFSKVDIFI